MAIAKPQSVKPATPRSGSGRCTSTTIIMLVFLVFFSMISWMYVSHDSHLRVGADKASHIAELEKLVARLEKEVAQFESKPATAIAANAEVEPEERDGVVIDTGNNEGATNESPAFVDQYSQQWAEKLKTKLMCLRLQKGALYLYHVRKAAGTSLRDVLHWISISWRVHFYETEGVVLDHSIFDHHGVTSVMTLREPISRIMSLYWYEHVGWFDGVLKQTGKCKKLSEWVAAWKDGTPWKTDFITKNPGTVYVEIENYYIKMLIGWKDPTHKIDEKDLEEAKQVLAQFDLVFLTDWMGDDTQIDAMNAVFPGRSSVSLGHKIRGDHNAKTRLSSSLAADEAAVREELTKLNALDLQLWEYAQSLMAYRLKYLVPMVTDVKRDLGLSAHANTLPSKQIPLHLKRHPECDRLDFRLSKEQKKNVGVIRPAGHKGPF